MEFILCVKEERMEIILKLSQGFDANNKNSKNNNNDNNDNTFHTNAKQDGKTVHVIRSRIKNQIKQKQN